jgi:hypothetical protein
MISADLAARIWPGQDPIGKRLKIGGVASRDPWRTIVGIAAPTRYRELAVHRPTLYLPAEQFVSAADILAVRTMSPGLGLVGVMRDAIGAVDPSIRVLGVKPFTTLQSARAGKQQQVPIWVLDDEVLGAPWLLP